MDSERVRALSADLARALALRQEPLAFFYTDREPQGRRPDGEHWACIIGFLSLARKGETVYFDADHLGCPGGGYYLGFCPPRPGIAEFVSTGIPGEMEGEHYKKSPELVHALLEAAPPLPAPAPFAVVKPVSKLEDEDRAEIIICFAAPDELSGLFTLANYPRAEDAVICPMGSGCSTIVTRPLHEARREQPRAVLGMFDVSARPFMPPDQLTFAVPVAMWAEMAQHAAQSFLKTESWAKVKKRITW